MWTVVHKFANWRDITTYPYAKDLLVSNLPLDTGLLLQWNGSRSNRGQMLRISRTANGEVLFTLSGRLDAENLAELKALLGSEVKGRRIVLDLKDLTLVDRDAVGFLERCEADSIKIKNCPAYIREWITGERRGS